MAGTLSLKFRNKQRRQGLIAGFNAQLGKGSKQVSIFTARVFNDKLDSHLCCRIKQTR